MTSPHKLSISEDDIKRLLDRAIKTDDILTEIATRYHRLVCVSQDDRHGAVIAMTAAAGNMTLSSLMHLSDHLDTLFRAISKLNLDAEPPESPVEKYPLMQIRRLPLR